MRASLEHAAEKYGCLGTSDWIRNGEPPTNNEIMAVMYFRSAEGLHAFAHSPAHREGWAWYIKTVEKHPYMGIWHETFVSPAGHWETVYMNERPMLLGAGQWPVDGKEGRKWASPVVDAMKGQLRTKWGRMGRTDGEDNEKYWYEEEWMAEHGVTEDFYEKKWLPQAMRHIKNAAI